MPYSIATPENYLNCTWYVQQDDLVGGWSITTRDVPPSQREEWERLEVANFFMFEEVAQHVVDLHNRILQQKEVSKDAE